jgi:hypothetical protein
MAEEKKGVEEADIADTVGPAANYAIAKFFSILSHLDLLIQMFQ